MSYLDVFDIQLPHYDQLVSAGDLVAVGPNQHPQFEVIAVRGDKAWLRDAAKGGDAIVSTSRLRRIV